MNAQPLGLPGDHLNHDPAWRDYLRGAPCPSWCEPALTDDGHPYAFDPSLDDPGQPLYQRLHARDLGHAAGLTLTAEQDDRAHAPRDPQAQLAAPWLWLHGPDVATELTADTARQLAAVLMHAADDLDALDAFTPHADPGGPDPLGVAAPLVESGRVDGRAGTVVPRALEPRDPTRPRGGIPWPLPWREAVSDWLAWLSAGGRSENTRNTYRLAMLHLAQRHEDPWAVTEDDLTRWLSTEGIKPATAYTRRTVVRNFYKWARRSGRCTTDPAAHLSSIRLTRSVPRPAPIDVLQRALATADARLVLAISLALYAGLRRAEIAGLHTRDLCPDSLLVMGKGRKERRVPLHPQLASLLRVELDRRHAGQPAPGWPSTPAADGWLFPSHPDPSHPLSARRLGTLMTAALGGEWTAHTVRHRFATEAYAAERDLRAVQELLGHSNPETTARYAAVPEGALNSAVAGVRRL